MRIVFVEEVVECGGRRGRCRSDRSLGAGRWHRRQVWKEVGRGSCSDCGRWCLKRRPSRECGRTRIGAFERERDAAGQVGLGRHHRLGRPGRSKRGQVEVGKRVLGRVGLDIEVRKRIALGRADGRWRWWRRQTNGRRWRSTQVERRERIVERRQRRRGRRRGCQWRGWQVTERVRRRSDRDRSCCRQRRRERIKRRKRISGAWQRTEWIGRGSRGRRCGRWKTQPTKGIGLGAEIGHGRRRHFPLWGRRRNRGRRRAERCRNLLRSRRRGRRWR